MKEMNLEAMEIINGGGWLDYAFGIGCGIGLGALVITTGGIGSAFVISTGFHFCLALAANNIYIEA